MDQTSEPPMIGRICSAAPSRDCEIELYFSIVQRKALTPNDLAPLDALAERLLGFGEHYRQIARPFEWTFTRQDLNKLQDRIDRQQPQLALAA